MTSHSQAIEQNLRRTPEQARAGDLRDRVGDLHPQLHARWDERQSKETKHTQREGNVDLLVTPTEHLIRQDWSCTVSTGGHGGEAHLVKPDESKNSK